jgi:hypothetical protein
MNSLDQVGIAGEGLKCRRVIGLEQLTNGFQLGSQIRELFPGHFIFEITPDPLNRVQLRAIRRQPHTAEIVRPAEALRGVSTTIIQEEEIQAVGERLGEGLDEELEHLRIQMRQFQEEPVASRGLHGALDVEPLKDVLHWPDGLHTTRGEAPAADREQAEAAFILAEHSNGACVGRRDSLLQVSSTARLEGRDRIRVFLCD